MRRSLTPLAILVLEFAIICAILELVQRRPTFDLSILPRPSAVANTFVVLLTDGTLFKAAAWSLLRVCIGYSVALLVGIPLGLLIGRYTLIDNVVGTWTNLIRPIPAMAWIPIAILWFGVGLESSSFLIFYGAVFPILINTASGVRSVDRVFVDSVRVLGATAWDIFRDVIFPGAMPAILTGMRIAVGIAWIVVVAAEMFGARAGLGYMITAGQMTYHVDSVLVGIAAIGLIGFGLDAGFRRLEARMLAWRS